MTAAAATLALLALLGSSGERFRGVARHADGRVAYVEEHEVRWDGGRPVSAETRYLDAAGRPIARLDSDYRPALFAPDYEFVDLRSGAREWVRRGADGLELGDGEARRLLAPPGDRPLVAGQGLDRFIRAHREALARGERLAVRLALPNRLSAYDFQVRGTPRAGGGLSVQVEPQNLILRLLAPAILAEYDAGGRLVRYRGVSNLAGADGSVQEVEIAYAHPDAASS
ncbi:MAG: hypothetical protein HZB56_12080 [Deltaproteobacteria bacterium]|nr:hypothetical protein [Deltaproteobacteria bacterium]